MFLIFRISQIDIVCNINKRHVAALMATTSPDVRSEYDEQHGNENRADAVSHDEHGVVADVTAYNTIDMQYRLHRTDVFPAE